MTNLAHSKLIRSKQNLNLVLTELTIDSQEAWLHEYSKKNLRRR